MEDQRMKDLEPRLKERSLIMLESSLNNPLYFALKLQEEVGEIAGAITKKAKGFNSYAFKKALEKEGHNIEDVPSGEDRALMYIEYEKKWLKKVTENAKEECADAFLILIQLAYKLGVDYSSLIDLSIKKFNQVNNGLGHPYTQLNINVDGNKEKESK